MDPVTQLLFPLRAHRILQRLTSVFWNWTMVFARRLYAANTTDSTVTIKWSARALLWAAIASSLYGCGHKGPLIAPERAIIEANMPLPEPTNSEQ